MRAVIQRVKKSRVEVKGESVGEIDAGILVFLAVTKQDTREDCRYLAQKIIHLRIFPDEAGHMNLSLFDTGGALLVVSQFTLLGDCRKGRRPSFIQAAEPKKAKELYDYFVELLRKEGVQTATGKFQEMMEVSLVNDGPVTLMLDSTKCF